MYVIVGATGNTGKVVAENLLSHGKKVRVLGRDPGRLKALEQKGAEPFLADVADTASIVGGFAGAKAAYLMLPPNTSSPDVLKTMDHVSDSLAAAVEKNGLEHVVVLSSVGADKPDRTGPVLSLRLLEHKLRSIGSLNAVFLRAGYFMSNLLPQAGIIGKFGVAGGPLRGDLKVAMISTDDIGTVAAETLLNLDFSGKHARELLGQRDVSYNEVATIIGKAIGNPDLKYTQFPPQQLKPSLMQMGMSASMADLLLEMSEALNSGYMEPLEQRSAINSTPTTIEEFVAKNIAPQFTGKAAGA
jgi:uncharacterized protein YbjT (DUF2867 family)